MVPSRCFWYATLMLALWVCPAPAHDSPEHVVERLTAQMARQGRTAELLYRRAGEYRALGRLDAAAADLIEAIDRDRDYLPARAELARVRLIQDNAAAALAAIEPALQRATSDDQRAAYRTLRSEAHSALGHVNLALEDCQWACRHGRPDVDRFLDRSRLQSQLGRHGERADELRAAMDALPSAALKIEWVEALIDAGRAEAALREIDSELADSRWRSSWLLRRARARLTLEQHAAAHEDLRAAIEEINGRLNPARPDVTLLADRGLALALLGQTAAARADLSAARRHRAGPWMLARLEAVLAASKPSAESPRQPTRQSEPGRTSARSGSSY